MIDTNQRKFGVYGLVEGALLVLRLTCANNKCALARDRADIIILEEENSNRHSAESQADIPTPNAQTVQVLGTSCS